MTDLLRDRLFLAWFLLVAVTVVSVMVGGSGDVIASFRAESVTTIVLAIAFAKVAVVVYEFMEVREAPAFLKILSAVWLAGVLCILLMIYFGLLP